MADEEVEVPSEEEEEAGEVSTGHGQGDTDAMLAHDCGQIMFEMRHLQEVFKDLDCQNSEIQIKLEDMEELETKFMSSFNAKQREWNTTDIKFQEMMDEEELKGREKESRTKLECDRQMSRLKNMRKELEPLREQLRQSIIKCSQVKNEMKLEEERLEIKTMAHSVELEQLNRALADIEHENNLTKEIEEDQGQLRQGLDKLLEFNKLLEETVTEAEGALNNQEWLENHFRASRLLRKVNVSVHSEILNYEIKVKEARLAYLQNALEALYSEVTQTKSNVEREQNGLTSITNSIDSLKEIYNKNLDLQNSRHQWLKSQATQTD